MHLLAHLQDLGLAQKPYQVPKLLRQIQKVKKAILELALIQQALQRLEQYQQMLLEIPKVL